ncbi:hypothetical protein AKJ09_07339 [Labilithrix luteola]|uniref:Uncharacterized protein n=1 Tax=Labilithrix luteola TaxID=1391654 RepID=A0A0K1Q4A8_9BACT|nr:hypothetical protein [Labilithrix luteola]AKV00676.1 hypothetical protein AKJ09_07339 [Labilithrix luteola]
MPQRLHTGEKDLPSPLIVTGELNGEDEFDAHGITAAGGDKIQTAITRRRIARSRWF